MHRSILRALRIILLGVVLAAVYLVWDRIRYERLLSRLPITLDDFRNDSPDYADMLVYPLNDTALREFNYSQYPHADPTKHIPPIIHFIYFPDLYHTEPEGSGPKLDGSRAPNLCRTYNPDFEVNVWNETAARTLLETRYEWFLPTYDGYAHPIQRVDAIKYFVLYTYGGFYLDLDVACRRQLQPLQRFPAWIPRASPQGLNNDVLATRAGHPAWKKMIESLTARDKWSRILLFPYLIIFWSTGPQFATDIIKQYFDKNPAHADYRLGSSKVDADPDDVYILPQEFYSEQYTFFGHSPGGTWHEGDVAVVVWFVARPWVLVLIVAVFIAAVLVLRYPTLLRRWRCRWLDRRNTGYTWLRDRDEEEEMLHMEMGDIDDSSRGWTARTYCRKNKR